MSFLPKELQLILQDTVRHTDIEYRADYSGRGMYGQTCPAVVCSEHEFYRLIMWVTVKLDALESSDLLDTWEDALNGVCVDNMGLGRVYYWR